MMFVVMMDTVRNSSWPACLRTFIVLQSFNEKVGQSRVIWNTQQGTCSASNTIKLYCREKGQPPEHERSLYDIPMKEARQDGSYSLNFHKESFELCSREDP